MGHAFRNKQAEAAAGTTPHAASRITGRLKISSDPPPYGCDRYRPSRSWLTSHHSYDISAVSCGGILNLETCPGFQTVTGWWKRSRLSRERAVGHWHFWSWTPVS